MAMTPRFLMMTCCAASLTLLAAACSGGGEASSPKGGGDASLQETLADPAPESETALDVEVLADGLDGPWCITFLPNGDILFTERAGRMRIIRDGELVEEPVAGVPEVLVYNQGGLFDILLHPDFEENGVLYISYAHGTEKENATRLARAVFDGSSLSDLEVLYDAKPLKDTGHHYGARLAWGGDGKLYMTIGEGSKYKEKAQDMTSSFGSVIRLNEDGSIPEDNPTFGEGERPELFTKGHRNPQGLAYDDERDILWSNEHGPRGGDEVNIIERGNNYGWPLATYGIDYNGAKISPFTEYEGTTQPVKYWTPSIGVSGLAVYRGDLFQGWDGDLLAGGLSGAALHRIIMDGSEPVGEERYLLDRGERVRDVRVGPDVAIYVATELREPGSGKILRLTPQ